MKLKTYLKEEITKKIFLDMDGVIVDFMDAVEVLSQSMDELMDRRDGEAVIRTYGVGAQILRDLGLSKIRVLSAPKQMHAISGFDLEITEYVED